MSRCILGGYTNFVWQGRDLRGGGARRGMKPTRENSVAREGTTDSLHKDPVEVTVHGVREAGDEARSNRKLVSNICG
jgi:hypothetical protein